MAIRDLIPWRERAIDLPRLQEDPFGALRREMNRVFEDLGRTFDRWPAFGSEGFAPPMDVRETDDEIQVTAEIPGLEEKDFELKLARDVLTIKGEKRRQHEDTGSVHRIERSYGAFERTVGLPCEVDADKATAAYRNGVLSVTLPKAPSALRHVHRIEVERR